MTDIKFILNTGAEIPAMGLGTWQSAPGEVAKAVSYSLSIGYKHIDCGMDPTHTVLLDTKLSSILLHQRRRGWRRTKVGVCKWGKEGRHLHYHEIMVHVRFTVEENLEKSLKSLGVDYVDLYLVHWLLAMNPKGTYVSWPPFTTPH
jgi:glycerol 2-dehydrogenase (NADP+)